MKKLTVFLVILALIALSGCGHAANYDIVATTLPVHDFTAALCLGTDLSVGRLVTENVSCLHDYTLQVEQMRMIESADVVVISGAGLEGFLEDALHNAQVVIDSSHDVHTHAASAHDHEHHGEHNHEVDPHIWLSPENAVRMAENIASNLSEHYPQYRSIFQDNLIQLTDKLSNLEEYGNQQLSEISCREIITFHDGFGYFAEAFGLQILESVEEESGSEASAYEIIHLVELIKEYDIPAVFIEKSGSDACASIIHAETDIPIYTLDMAMSGDSYFDAIYHNIDTIKEALG